MAIRKKEPRYYCLSVVDNCLSRKLCYLESSYFFNVYFIFHNFLDPLIQWFEMLPSLYAKFEYRMNIVSGLCVQGHWHEGQYFWKYNTVLISVALFTNLYIFFKSSSLCEPLFIDKLFSVMKLVTIQYYWHFKYVNNDFS